MINIEIDEPGFLKMFVDNTETQPQRFSSEAIN